MLDPDALAHRLAGLEVRVDAVRVEVGEVETRAYPGGRRPTSTLIASGAGHEGRGENVDWTLEAHEAFSDRAGSLLAGSDGTVASLTAGVPAEPYVRAALEAALVDLALRQQGSTLAALAGMSRGYVPYAISFDAGPDPAARVDAVRRTNPGARFKVDVDPAWTDATIAQLAETDAVHVLDFKDKGDGALVGRFAEAMPDAILEDPPGEPVELAPRIARDIPILGAPDVDAHAAGCGWINVKAPRMGGFLEVLRAIARARELGLGVYFGGMFEVGVGRTQARGLAALYAGDVRSDLAPIPVPGDEDEARDPSPLAVRLDALGLG